MNEPTENQKADIVQDTFCAIEKGRECIRSHPVRCGALLLLLGVGIGSIVFRKEAKPASAMQTVRDWLDATYADAISRLPDAGKVAKKEKDLLKKAGAFAQNLRFW
jgi:hypothetical protein